MKEREKENTKLAPELVTEYTQAYKTLFKGKKDVPPFWDWVKGVQNLKLSWIDVIDETAKHNHWDEQLTKLRKPEKRLRPTKEPTGKPESQQ